MVREAYIKSIFVRVETNLPRSWHGSYFLSSQFRFAYSRCRKIGRPHDARLYLRVLRACYTALNRYIRPWRPLLLLDTKIVAYRRNSIRVRTLTERYYLRETNDACLESFFGKIVFSQRRAGRRSKRSNDLINRPRLRKYGDPIVPFAIYYRRSDYGRSVWSVYHDRNVLRAVATDNVNGRKES